GEDHRSLRRCGGHFERSGECRPRGNPAENALAARQRPRALDRLGVADRHDSVGYVALEDLGNEIRGPALDLVRCPALAREERGPRGLAGDDLYLGSGEADHLSRSRERASRAPAGDEVVEPLTDEILQDLAAGRV